METPLDQKVKGLTNFLKDMQIISALDDQPNDVGGLTAAELKAKFDEGGVAIQKYLNETLITELESQNAASSLGAVDHDGQASTVQAELDKLSNISRTAAEALDKVVENNHTHSNKAVLDSITSVTQVLGDSHDCVPSEAAVAAALTMNGNLPSGGTAGQVLIKQTNQPFDATWGVLAMPGKADIVANAVAGNLALLDENGNLADSGKAPGDFAPAALLNTLYLYVDAENGSDTNPGTLASPFATVQAAINAVPKNLGGFRAIISLSPGTYPGNAEIVGFYGGGGYSPAIEIKSKEETATIQGNIFVYGTAGFIKISNLKVQGRFEADGASGVVAVESAEFDVSNADQGYGIRFLRSSCGYVRNCTVNNADNTAVSACASTVYIYNLSGSGNAVAVSSGDSAQGGPALAAIGSSTVTGEIKYSKQYGSVIMENGVLV